MVELEGALKEALGTVGSNNAVFQLKVVPLDHGAKKEKVFVLRIGGLLYTEMRLEFIPADFCTKFLDVQSLYI